LKTGLRQFAFDLVAQVVDEWLDFFLRNKLADLT